MRLLHRFFSGLSLFLRAANFVTAAAIELMRQILCGIDRGVLEHHGVTERHA